MINDTTHLFCFIDDFCKKREQEKNEHLIANGQPIIKPTRAPNLTEAEVLTITLLYYQGVFHSFKAFYKFMLEHHKNDFPNMPTYERFIILKQRILPLLLDLFNCILTKTSDHAYIDSTAIRVCNNKRTGSHKVFKDCAQVGKSSMGWFFGFKLHLAIDLNGNLVNAYISTGNCSDVSIAEWILRDFRGTVFGDKGYISKQVFDKLMKKGIKLVTGLKGNMKNKLLSLKEKLYLRKRSLIETVFNMLKQKSLEHSRHRSIAGFCIHILCVLIAYQLKTKKPSISMN